MDLPTGVGEHRETVKFLALRVFFSCKALIFIPIFLGFFFNYVWLVYVVHILDFRGRILLCPIVLMFGVLYSVFIGGLIYRNLNRVESPRPAALAWAEEVLRSFGAESFLC